MNKQILLSALITLTFLNMLAAENVYTPNGETGRSLSIEPGFGISPMPLADITVSNLMQLKLSNRIAGLSYTSLKVNNPFQRDFNYIKTCRNYTLSQKIGLGISFDRKKSVHTFSVLGGIKYETFSESLENPEFEKIRVTVTSTAADAGFLYAMKFGKRKYFISSRIYLPVMPYPVRTYDFTAIDGNLANVALEIGLGIHIK